MLVERYNTKKYKIYQQENPADEEENDRRKHGFMDLYFSVHLGFEKTERKHHSSGERYHYECEEV